MSFGLMAFAVNLRQIRKAVGSRSKSLLLELREEFEDELTEDREQVEEANEDDDFDPELSLEDALRHLIMDEERWDYEGPKYGHAVEMICSFYGEFLPNDHWTGIPVHWPESVDEALHDTGVSVETFSILNHLLNRSLPIDIPEIDDFPAIGYLTQAEIPTALAALTDERFDSMTQDDSQKIRTSLEQVREWLEICQREKSDLVCFYY